MEPRVVFSNTKVTQVTSDSITLTWDYQLTGISEEDVQFQVAAKGDFPDGGFFRKVDADCKNSCTFPGMKDDTDYDLWLIAVDGPSDQVINQYPDDEQEESWTVRTKVLDEDAPTAESRELTVSEPTLEGFTLKWKKAKDEVTDAKDIRYEVWLKEAAGDGEPELYKGRKNIASITVKGLKKATRYAFYVLAIDEVGNALRYPSKNGFGTAETLDDEAPTVGDDTITVKDCGQDSFTIRWKPATDNDTEQEAIRYKVYLKEHGTPEDQWGEPVGDSLGVDSHVFTGLKADTQYDFCVIAYDRSDNPLTYRAGSASTNDKEAPKADPKSLSVVKTAKDSITVKWSPATDNVTAIGKISYEVWWTRNDNKDTWHSATVGTNVFSYTISGLTESAEYRIYVKALDESKNEFKYQQTLATTLDKTAPTVDSKSVKVDEQTFDSITIKWNLAQDKGTARDDVKYEVWWKKDDTSNQWNHATAGAGASSYTITGLKESTQYVFYIKAFDKNNNEAKFLNDGGWYQARTTDRTAPKANADSLEVTAVTCNSISLKWEKATDDLTESGKIKYTVKWREDWIRTLSWFSAPAKYGVSTHTITGLREMTPYAVTVEAADESGNKFSYKTRQAKTLSSDTSKPTVDNNALTVRYVDKNSFSIKWNPATDNKTAREKIVYQVYLMPPVGEPNRKWTMKKEDSNFYSYTFTDLNSGSAYECYVVARDEAGNETKYPAISVKTTVTNYWSKGGKTASTGAFKDPPAFQMNLGDKFNRYRFEINFDCMYIPLPGIKVSDRITIMSLDSKKNTLCLYFAPTRSGKTIYVGVNNCKNSWDTGIVCKSVSQIHISLKYQNGNLTINGKSFSVGALDPMARGDNLLSCQNYLDKTCFMGAIANVEVASY